MRFRPKSQSLWVYQNAAIQLAFRVLSIAQGREWISKPSEDNSQVRAVIKAAGVLGDPHAVNWLISKMQDPTLAGLAGELFTGITGIDLEEYNLLSDEAEQPHPDIFDDETDTTALLDPKVYMPAWA